MNLQEVNNVVAQAISELSDKYSETISGVDEYELLKYSVTLAKHESSFNEKAKNKNSSARGLFQILTKTEQAIKSNIIKSNITGDIYEPLYNSILGVAYLAYQFKRYKNNWRSAVIAYNLGHYTTNMKDTAYYKEYVKDFQEINNNNELALNNVKIGRKFF